MTHKFISNYLHGLEELFDDFDIDSFTYFMELIEKKKRQGSLIFIFGNGGSGSLASHFACDLNKGASFGKASRFKAICLNDNIPTILAYANDLSYSDIFVEQLKNFLTKDDLVIGVSGSGKSENVLRAIDYAKKKGARTVGLCGFDGGDLKNSVEHSLFINSHDMQKVEDMFSIIFHCAMQWLGRMYTDKESN